MTPQTAPLPANRDQHRILLACAAAYSIANVGWWVQPAIINEVIVRYQVGEAQSGLIASAEMTAIALGSMTLAKLLGRWSLRQIALTGIVITLTGALLSVLAQSYGTLLVSRAITGCGEGAMLAVATAALANFRNPDRAYGQINIVAILFGTLVFFSLPITGRYLGDSRNVFPTVLASVAVLALLLALMPKDTDPRSGGPSRARSGHAVLSTPLICLAVAVFIVGVTSGAMWSFYFLLGTHAGLDESQIHTAVTLSALLSVVGALLATLVGARFGRFLPVTLGIALLTAAIAALAHWHDPLVFQVAACVNVAGMYFLVPYFLAYAATQDPSGRDAAFVGGVFLLTGAAGPYFGGYIFEAFDIGVMTMFVICTNTVAWLLFIAVERLQCSSRTSQIATCATPVAAPDKSSSQVS